MTDKEVYCNILLRKKALLKGNKWSFINIEQGTINLVNFIDRRLVKYQ